MQPGAVLLVGVGLIAVLLFIGGVIDVFRIPARLKRRRRRKRVSRRPEELAPRFEWPRPTPEAGTVVGPQEPPAAPARPNSHVLTFLATAVCAAVMLSLFIFQDGGFSSVESHPTRAVPRLARQAEARANVGDYEGAWTLYYQALRAAPQDISLWYGLGVTLSHLHHPKETQEAFEYVVRHARPNSEEAKRARRWLVSAGVLAEPVRFSNASERTDGQGRRAALAGKVTWGAPQPGEPPLRVQLLLEGLSEVAAGKRFYARTTLGQSYRFERLPAGTYRLIGAATGQPLWDLTLTLEDGKEVVLDLGNDNSSNPGAALYP